MAGLPNKACETALRSCPYWSTEAFTEVQSCAWQSSSSSQGRAVLAGNQQSPRTPGSNGASQSSRHQGRRKKGPLPCQEGDFLHQHTIALSTSSSQARLSTLQDRPELFIRKLLQRVPFPERPLVQLCFLDSVLSSSYSPPHSV